MQHRADLIQRRGCLYLLASKRCVPTLKPALARTGRCRPLPCTKGFSVGHPSDPGPDANASIQGSAGSVTPGEHPKQHQQQQQKPIAPPVEPTASHDSNRPHDAASAAAAAAAAPGQLRHSPTAAKRPASSAKFSFRAALGPLYQLLLGLLGLARGWLQYILVRAGVGTALALLALHLLLNKVAAPLVNKSVLPGLLQQAEAATLREVHAVGVSSLSLAGLVGLGPVLRLQQLEVGPGPVERSSAQIPEVTVSVLPAASIARRQLLLQVGVQSPRVRVVQGTNFSWLGYPMDTLPSSRDLLPGLTQQQQQQQQLQQQPALNSSSTASLGLHLERAGNSGAGSKTSSGASREGPFPASVTAQGTSSSRRGPPFAAVPSTSSSGQHTQQRPQQQQWSSSISVPSSVGSNQSEDQLLLEQRRASHAAASSSKQQQQQQQQQAGFSLSRHMQQRRGLQDQQDVQQQAHVPDAMTAADALAQQAPRADGQPMITDAAEPGEPNASAPSVQTQQWPPGSRSAVPHLLVPKAAASTAVAAGSAAAVSSDEVETDVTTSTDEAASQAGSSSSDHDDGTDSSHQQQQQQQVSSSHHSASDSDDSSQGTDTSDTAEDAAHQQYTHQPQSSLSSGGMIKHTAAGPGSASYTPAAHQQQQQQASNILSAAQHGLHTRLQQLSHSIMRSVNSAARGALTATAHTLSTTIQLPPPALHSVVLTDGRLAVAVHGEPLDRHVHDIGLKLTLGPQYGWMEIVVEADAAPRHPVSIKCTQINTNAKRHLRHVTPGAAGAARLRKFSCDVLPPPPATVTAAAVGVPADESGIFAPAEDSVAGSSDHDGISSSTIGHQPETTQQQQLAASGSIGNDSDSSSLQQQGQQQLPAETSTNPTQLGDAVPSNTLVVPSSSSSSSSAPGFPLATLHIPSGQLMVPSSVHFQLPGELQGAPAVDEMPQTGGGHLSVRVVHQWSKQLTGRDNLFVSVAGRRLSAPLIERLLELPMDISSGTVDGEIHIAANDDATWEFPAITGKVTCKDVDLHFWDSPDDVVGANMDLLFERDRVYLHKATGSFGAIPLSVSGDLDLCPQAGQYRLQAAVGPVEVNSLRASLGVRPIPFPIAGALRGVLHVTGPLEKPIFSGSASAVRPPPALLVGVEDSPALAALLQNPAAVAAYDRVPATAANGVFTLDTATEMFVLHSGQAVPAGGGLIQAAGKMWVAAAAETDPRAIVMEAGASGLNAAALATSYVTNAQAGSLSSVDTPSSSPAAVLSGVGPLNVRGSLSGSHVAPTTRLEWAAPSSGLAGHASLSPTAVSMATAGPGFKLKASAATSNPTAEQARNANTQAEATFYGTPRVEAFQLEGSLAGVDLLPLTAAATATQPAQGQTTGSSPSSMIDPAPAMVDGSPVRLKVTGGLKLSAVRDNSDAARRQAGLAPAVAADKGGYLFTGPVVLDGLRVNQLQLCRQLTGDVSLTEPRFLLRGRGAGRTGDELLELDLALPAPPATPAAPGPHGTIPTRLYYPPGFAPAVRQQLISLPAAASGVSSSSAGGNARSYSASGHAVGEGGGAGGSDEWPDERLPWSAQGAADSAVATDVIEPTLASEAQRVSHILLRRGDLHFSSTVNGVGSVFGAALEHLPLDELELGSLRGLLVSAVLDVDLTAAAGRLAASLASPRFSGLAGTSLTANARWERDVILLEQAVLTQPNSKYQLAAEYILPPGYVLPGSIAEAQHVAAAAAAGPHIGSSGDSRKLQASKQQQRHEPDAGAAQQVPQPSLQSPEGGRWRVQLLVPHAAVEELLPAGQLLRQASRRAGVDQHKAKANFLTGLAAAAINAGEEFSIQVAALAEAAASAAVVAAASAGQPAPTTTASGSSSVPSLPGLQELRGSWSGRLVAVGGGSAAGAEAAPQLEYDLAGAAWKAGPYTLDQLVVRGSADAVEGVNLDELKLVIGGATLAAKGSMLGQQQDASFSLTDFPAVLLQPLFVALPALQHAAPALDMRAGGSGGKPSSSNSSSVFPLSGNAALSGLSSRLESSLSALGIKLPGTVRGDGEVDPLQPFLSSPVSGLLNVRGAVGGSAAAPTGALHVKLVDGALGRQRLARATASLALNTQQQLACEVELAPADSHGHIKVAGSAGLAGTGQTPDAADGQQRDQGQLAGDAAGRNTSKGTAVATRDSKARGKKGRKHQHEQASQRLGPRSQATAGAAVEPELELTLNVKDGGIALLTGLAPGLSWGGGTAAISVAATGPAAAPVITGNASFNKGSLSTAFLKHPVTQLTGSLSLDGQHLTVAGLEAKVGPKGTVALRGSLPVTALPAARGSGSNRSKSHTSPAGEGLDVALTDIDLRVRNMYSGSLDACVHVGGSLDAPGLGGAVTFSRGTAYLVPPAAAGGSAGDAAAAPTPSSRELGQAELVRTAFAALKAGRARAALDHKQQQGMHKHSVHPQQHAPTMRQDTPLSSPWQPAAGASSSSSGPASGQPQLVLTGLELVFGPELRAVFPVVLNVGISGRLHLAGNPAVPGGLLPAGRLVLEGGVLNLVATQFRLDREHPNTMTFTPEAGLDPLLELALSSSELRAVVSGRASAWQEHLSLTATGTAAAGGGGAGAAATGIGAAAGVAGSGGSVVGAGSSRDLIPGLEGLTGDPLGGRVVARVFEGRLAEALLAEDGSLSLATLAGNTLGSLLPKIETQGQLGKARWRLVSAPSLPGLLSSADPQAAASSRAGGGGVTSASDAGPGLLRSLALGTEVELALGRSLVAALSHNMPAAASDGGGEPGTEVRLSLALNRQLRLLVQQRGLRLQPSVLLQFNSEGMPWIDPN